jgi:hypothetical protein
LIKISFYIVLFRSSSAVAPFDDLFLHAAAVAAGAPLQAALDLILNVRAPGRFWVMFESF